MTWSEKHDEDHDTSSKIYLGKAVSLYFFQNRADFDIKVVMPDITTSKNESFTDVSCIVSEYIQLRSKNVKHNT